MIKHIEHEGKQYPVLLDLAAVERIEEEIDYSLMGVVMSFQNGNAQNFKVSIFKSLLYNTMLSGAKQEGTEMPCKKEESGEFLVAFGIAKFLADVFPQLMEAVLELMGRKNKSPTNQNGTSEFKKKIKRMRKAPSKE